LPSKKKIYDKGDSLTKEEIKHKTILSSVKSDLKISKEKAINIAIKHGYWFSDALSTDEQRITLERNNQEIFWRLVYSRMTPVSAENCLSAGKCYENLVFFFEIDSDSGVIMKKKKSKNYISIPR